MFGLGSLFAALAGGTTELIAARALMGVGAAAIMPATLSVVTNIFPDHERPKAIAVWAAVAGLGVAIGPITGGWLIEHVDWRGIFLVNIPAVAACLIGAAVLVPESRDPGRRASTSLGAALSVAGLSALVWGLIEAPERGWTDPLILGAFAAGAAILAAFVAWERRVEQPMLQVRVFRNLRFSAASASIAFVYFALMGVLYLLTTYLQSVLGYSAFDAGMRMLPIAAGMIVASRLSVGLAARLGTKVVVARGLAIVAGALVMLAGFEVDTGDTEIAARAGPDGLRHRARDDARDGGDHGLAAAGQGRHRLGDERHRPRGRRHARRRGARQHPQQRLRARHGRSHGRPAAGAAAAASDSVGAAQEVAAEVGGSAGADLVAASTRRSSTR